MNLNLRFFSRNSVPVILQSQVTECGLACLAMIASYNGLRIDLSYLRTRWSVSAKGLALPQMMEVARLLHLLPRAIRLDTIQLQNLNTPCILHWNMDHFVVLESASKNNLKIVDPAIGRRIVTGSELKDKFTGVAVELLPTEGFVRENRQSSLKLWHLLSGTKGLFSLLLQLLAFSLVIQVFALAAPFYTQIIIDDVVLSGDIDLLNLLFAVFITLKLLQIVTTAIRSWVIVYLGMKLKLMWTSKLFHHLIRLPMSYFDSRHIGDIQSRYGSLSALQDLVTTKFVETVVDGLLTVTTLFVLFAYDAVLATIVLASTVLYLLVRLGAYPRLRLRAQEALIASAQKESYFLETLRGLLTIKNFSMEHRRESSFQNRVVDTINANVRVLRIGIIEVTVSQLILSMQLLLVVWLAAKSILAGSLTVGMMVAFLAFRALFSERSMLLVDRAIEFKLSRVHLDRLSDIIETDVERGLLSTVDQPIPSGLPIQRIDAINLCYRYADTESYVIKNATFSLAAGEYVVIKGPSGLGKTTLLKLLMGLLTPSKGELQIDGATLANYGIQQYRQVFSAVMQNDSLLAGTLMENISFFDPLVNQERVEACAEMAAIAGDIEKMPMRYLSLVGDMGDALSGGQKQRILLARALYKRPSVLFLDEASSHLDVDNERRIIAGLKRLRITIIGVAHRSESIRCADRVVDIEHFVTTDR